MSPPPLIALTVPPAPPRGRWQPADTARPVCKVCGAPMGGPFVDVVGRLAHLVSYLVSRGRAWNLDEHKVGRLHISYSLNERTGRDEVRCWRDIREDTDLHERHGDFE